MRSETPNYSKEKAFVLQKYPDAWVDDDGEAVRIYLPEKRDSPCGECSRPWKRSVRTTAGRCLGSGGQECYAWIRAAQALGYKSETPVSA